MPAPLSIVIPTLNAEEALPDCLARLVEGLSEGLLREVIVTDGGSTDATVAIAEAAGARVITGAAGRGGQLCAGMAAARGSWLLALHADSHLPQGWPEMARAHMENNADLAGYFRLRFRSSHVLAGFVSGWANLRSALFGMPYGDQGLLVSRRLYDQVGGYADVPLMEDVILARTLCFRPIGGVITTSADRYEAEGWLRRGWRNARLRWRHRLGEKTQILAKDYD